MSIDTVTWNAAFAVINLLQCAMLLHAERPIKLHPMEEEIYLRVFLRNKVPLGRRDFKLLASKASILDYEDGEAYLQQGSKVETVALIMSGQVDVFDNFEGHSAGPFEGRFAKINVSESWEWVDSPQFIFNINSEHIPQPAAVSLVAAGPTQLCVWTLEDIRGLCAANPQLSVCILSVISQDCAVKIMKTEKYIMSSEAVRRAAHSSLREDDRIRRASSFVKSPISAKERVKGYADSAVVDMAASIGTHSSLDLNKSSIAVNGGNNSSPVSPRVLNHKASRKIGSIATPIIRRESFLGSNIDSTGSMMSADDISNAGKKKKSSKTVIVTDPKDEEDEQNVEMKSLDRSSGRIASPDERQASFSAALDLDESKQQNDDGDGSDINVALSKPPSPELTYPKKNKKGKKLSSLVVDTPDAGSERPSKDGNDEEELLTHVTGSPVIADEDEEAAEKTTTKRRKKKGKKHHEETFEEEN
jgi:CRP-like cAMP-binding protein